MKKHSPEHTQYAEVIAARNRIMQKGGYVKASKQCIEAGVRRRKIEALLELKKEDILL